MIPSSCRGDDAFWLNICSIWPLISSLHLWSRGSVQYDGQAVAPSLMDLPLGN